MSVNLQKGQKISLVKPGEPGLKRIMVGLGWDEVEQKRGWFAPKPQDIDCDASVILCGADGRIISNDYSGRTGLVVGEIYRHNGEWKFNAIGQGVTEASRLAELVRLYQ